MPHVEFINPAQAEDNIATLKIDDQIYSLEQVMANTSLASHAVGDFYPTTPFNSTNLQVNLTKNPSLLAKEIFADDQLKEIIYTDNNKFIVLKGSFATDTILNITFISPFGVILSNATFTNFEIVNILSPSGVVYIYNCMAANLTMDSSSILFLGEVVTFKATANTKHFIEKGSITANSLDIKIATALGSVNIFGKILIQNDISFFLAQSTIHIDSQASIESTQGFIKIYDVAQFTNNIFLKGKAGIEIRAAERVKNNKIIATHGLLSITAKSFESHGEIEADVLHIEITSPVSGGSGVEISGKIKTQHDATIILGGSKIVLVVGSTMSIEGFLMIKDAYELTNNIYLWAKQGIYISDLGGKGVGVVNNKEIITHGTFEVWSKSFDNYNYVEVVNIAKFVITHSFSNQASGMIKLGGLLVQNPWRQISQFTNLGIIKANDAVIITTEEEVTVSGTIQSMDEIKIKGTNLVLASGAKIEALKAIELKVESLQLMQGSLIQSYGLLSIERGDGSLVKSIIIQSAAIKAGGNAVIKARELINTRFGGYFIGRTNVHDRYVEEGKWGMQVRCHKDDWANTLQPQGWVYVGGNLVFDGLKIENTLSLFEVTGDLSFIQKCEVKNQNVELKIYSYTLSWGIQRRDWLGTAIREAAAELASRCGYGLTNYGQQESSDQKIWKKEPSTFAVLGTMSGEFTGLLSSSISRNIGNQLSLLPPDIKQVDFAGSTQIDFYLPSVLRIDEILVQVYNPLSKLASIINSQMIFTERSDASFAPFVSYYHPPLIPCEYGTSELLQELGVDKTKYPQIFGSADIEKSLIEHGMFELTGVSWLSIQAVLAISHSNEDSVTPEDKGCTQLKLLLSNGLKIKEQYELEAGKSLANHHLQELSLPFVWPVARVLQGGKEVLVLELYLPQDIVKNAPARYGSAMLLGSIDIKADTFITTGLFMVNDGAKIRANNIGLAGRFVVNNGDATLSAVYDIVNVGTTRVAGNLYLNAGHDIKELILINPAHPVQELTKRAIYAIGGSLYYKAEHDIIQQGSVIFASGDVVMNAGHDIVIESVHQSRVVKEESSRKHYIIHSTVDQFDAVIMVNGKVEMTAGHNFIGSGVKLLASTGDVRINAGESVVLEDKTGYAWSHGSKTKNKFLGTSKVSVSWTTDKTAQVEITAPGGAVYISSKECTLEGGRIDGKKPIFKCDKLLIKPHKITKRIETTRKEDGLIATKLPVGDLINSDHPEKHLRDNTIAGQINDLLHMQGPLDLLPAVNVFSAIPGLKANYNLLKGKQTEFSPASLIGALLSKYISAGISIGNQKTSTTVTQEISTLSQINGEECEFTGNDLDIAANVKCKDKLKIEANNLKLQGAKDTLEIDSTTESSGIDINLGLSGLSFAVSFGDGNVQQTKEQHKAGTYHATNISIKVNNKLEIENAQINGKNVKVEALILEIKQVIDSSRTEGENSGISLGVNIGFDGGLTPIASLSHSESLQQTQVIQFLSGISGETVEVTAKSLEYNVAAITATQDLDIRADNINYIALPRTENIDTETQVAASITPRADGKSSYFASLYNRDGNKVMSMGWSSDLIEGIKDIIGGAESLLGKNDDGMNYKPLNQEPDQQEPKPESKPKSKEENNPAKPTSGEKTKPTDEKKSDGEKEGVERYNEELAKHTYLKVSKEIDNINGLSEGQKTESKALAQKEINDFVNADAKTKERIISKYNNQIQDLEQQLADQKFYKTSLGKVSGFFSKIFGTNRAEAELITTTIGLSIGLEEGFSVLVVIGIGLYTVAKIQESISKGTILSTPIHENKGTTHSTPVHENKGDVEGYSIPEYIRKLPGFEPTADGFKLPGFEVHVGDDLRILYKDSTGVEHYEYWDKNVEFKGNKVYQRDDLIQPNFIRPDGKGTNLEAMKKGYAPLGPDGRPVNLHHLIQTPDGAISEITQSFHQQYKKIIHINPPSIKSEIDRESFRPWREKYWQNRVKDFEKGE